VPRCHAIESEVSQIGKSARSSGARSLRIAQCPRPTSRGSRRRPCRGSRGSSARVSGSGTWSRSGRLPCARSPPPGLGRSARRAPGPAVPPPRRTCACGGDWSKLPPVPAGGLRPAPSRPPAGLLAEVPGGAQAAAARTGAGRRDAELRGLLVVALGVLDEGRAHEAKATGPSRDPRGAVFANRRRLVGAPVPLGRLAMGVLMGSDLPPISRATRSATEVRDAFPCPCAQRAICEGKCAIRDAAVQDAAIDRTRSLN